MSGDVWHIVTGEYPPLCGGVGDHTAQVAVGLAQSGQLVHVWCPGAPRAEDHGAGPVVHRLASGFGLVGLYQLGRALDRAQSAPRALLVQYAPNALGLRGLNLPFCLWLLGRARRAGDEVRTVLHEPYFYFARQPLRRNILAAVQRAMAVALFAASRRIYVSAAAWEHAVRRYGRARAPLVRWAPMPSTIACDRNPAAVHRLRDRYAKGAPLVGHFGTYGPASHATVAPAILELLSRHPEPVLLCIGSGSDRFVTELTGHRPWLTSRLVGTGALSAASVSHHLQACDLVLQPYPDGVTTRRTSVMAALAHGVATVTTEGALSEAIWRREGAVELAPAGDVAALVDGVGRLLRGKRWRMELGARGRDLYERDFSLASFLALLELDAGTSARPRGLVA